MTEKQYLKWLGNRIMEARETLGLSREALAKKVKLTRMHVYRIEEGKNPTNIIVLRRIAKEFAMSLRDLVDK
jgi:ribosome-binding protein aMBF1 (putative translation factor)